MLHKDTQDQAKQVGDLKQRVEQASRALERMASENVGLRKQVQTLEKQKCDQEIETQKKSIDGMQDLRQKEQKLKLKCQKLTREKSELLVGIKDLQNEYSMRENQYRTIIAELEAQNSQIKLS